MQKNARKDSVVYKMTTACVVTMTVKYDNNSYIFSSHLIQFTSNQKLKKIKIK